MTGKPTNKCQLPPPLKPGDRLRVITPSGTLRELEAFEKGVKIWRDRGYQIEYASHWDARCGYLAGKDSQRREALAEAWFDPECKGILCARGGYGSTRLLENWRWDIQSNRQKTDPDLATNYPVPSPQSPVPISQFPSHQSPAPKWLIGFSDVTALLWSLAKAGISGLHAPVLTTLSREPQWSIERLFDCVEGRSVAPLTGNGWGGDVATGILLPANLTVATHLLNTPLQPNLEGTILALEDVTEAPYRIDRMLTQWRMSGAFAGVKGIALGRFSQCCAPEGIPSWTVEEVLSDRLIDLNIPIVSDLAFGHEGANAALPVGQFVTLDGSQGILAFQSQESITNK
ncbi:MAG: LD-carboxypeptidase [Oscillatoria sp. PMC 1051.18]|nr:LD-carboxypeptidase [Oscillatoria sp. PMC 1050.18]MEC5028825.1 LD-carboxypeptidase [Oscillatoria sp. PMC 1051.18]